MLPGLHSQVGHEFFAGGSFGSNLNFALESKIFGCHQLKKIVNDLPVEAACIRAGAYDSLTIEKKDGAVF